MEALNIRLAEERDLADLDTALSRLSRELGDPHRAGADALGRALFGVPKAAWAQVAEHLGGIVGAVLFAPVFSTVRGGAGVFVSDLWVDDAVRGAGLGAALIGRAADTASTNWGASFMRLSVHDGNARALSLYSRLGFEPARGETTMVLAGEEYQKVRGTE